jgi:RES domain-containing protein
MPLVWRLVRPAFARDLDGEGSRITGGRWNRRGKAVVYTSSHLSLSVLETYVHLPSELREDLPEMEAVSIRIPEGAGSTKVTAERFDVLMTAPDPYATCQSVGDDWFTRGADLALEVPSVLVPEETNVVLNALHPAMREVRIVASRTFRFDPRLSARH